MTSKKEKKHSIDSESKVIGRCGDTISTELIIKDNIITRIKQYSDGCVYTSICASITSSIVNGLSLEEALRVSPEMVIEKAINIPEDHLHCAKLSINSLGEAISNYYHKKSKNKLSLNGKLITIVIATKNSTGLEKFTNYLEEKFYTKVKYFSEIDSILKTINNELSLLVIRDDSLDFDSVELIQKTLKANAFVNIVVMCNYGLKEFERKFDGFGILMKLSDPPNEKNAKILIKKLKHCLASFIGEAK